MSDATKRLATDQTLQATNTALGGTNTALGNTNTALGLLGKDSSLQDIKSAIIALPNATQQAADNANAAAASATAAVAQLGGLVAPTFSTSTAYSAGQYVYYDSKLYRFTADHAAGAWNSSQVVNVPLGNDVSDLKSAFYNSFDTNNLYDATYTARDGWRFDGSGNLTQTGATNCFVSNYIVVKAGEKYYKNSPANDVFHKVVGYAADRTTILLNYNGNVFDIPENCTAIRIGGLLTEKSTTIVSLASMIDFEAREDIKELGDFAIDTDKKVDNVYKKNLFQQSFTTDGYRILNDGTYATLETAYVSDFIPVEPNETYIYNSPTQDAFHKIVVFGFARNAITADNVSEITIPALGRFVRFCGYKTEKNTATFIKKESVPNTIIARKIDSHFGESGLICEIGNASAETMYWSNTFPFYLKKNIGMSCYGEFATFSKISIGKGRMRYNGGWVEITDTQLEIHYFDTNDHVIETVNHGLTINSYIFVNMYLDKNDILKIAINTLGGSFTYAYTVEYGRFAGFSFVRSEMAMTNAKLSMISGDLRKPLWVIGDSYFGTGDNRVLGQLKNMGYWDGYAADGLAGLDSLEAWEELGKMVMYALPKYLVWYLGMNDTNAQYETYLVKVKNFCNINGIELIINRVPTCPVVDNETKSTTVTSSGLRYIDSYSAVGANSDGTWYTGYLAGDNVHPTEKGAIALAQRFALDVPEVMMYGYELPTN